VTRKQLFRPEHLRWRVGRKVGRTIYAQLADAPGDHDPLIGLMDTKALAQAAVRAHNDRLMPKRSWRGRRPANEDAQATPPNPVGPPRATA